MTGRVLSLDFETFAHRNLTKVGLHNYLDCPHFAVTVIAWAFDGDPVKSVVWPTTKLLPSEIVHHIAQGGIIHAWNTAFEFGVLSQHYRAPVRLAQMECTMQRALAAGYPMSLAEAGPALGLAIVKDKTARKLMLEMGSPPKKGVPYHEWDTQRLTALDSYCRKDVEAEREAGRHLPVLSQFEKELSLVDAMSNLDGIPVDSTAVYWLVKARDYYRNKARRAAAALTGGFVARVDTEAPKLKKWLSGAGYPMASINKEAVAKALLDPAAPDAVKAVLGLRQAASKSSLAKLETMLDVRGLDGRARGQLQYYGACRTGRWAGRDINVQNLPKSRGDVDVDVLLGTISADVTGLELFHASPLDALSASLRGCLTAGPGKLLAMIDFSQIEARILAWLSGQQDVVDAFARNEDVYTLQARKVGSSNRNLGKVLVLACGYGMGPARFRETAATYGVILSDEEAQDALAAWKGANSRIVHYWWDLQAAAVAAMGVKPARLDVKPHGPVGGLQTFPRGVFIKKVGGALVIKKPGGGKLYYHNARVTRDHVGNLFGFEGPMDQGTKWIAQTTYGGKFCENICQSVARDILAEAYVRIYRAMGMVPVFSVHDELVYEVENDWQAMALQDLADTAPAWAVGLPLASKLHVAFRYAKGD